MKPEQKAQIIAKLKLRQDPEKVWLEFMQNLAAEMDAKQTKSSDAAAKTLRAEMAKIEEKLRAGIKQTFEAELKDFETLIEELRGIDGKDVEMDAVIERLLSTPDFIEKTKAKDPEPITDEHLLSLITPLIPKPIPGDAGKTPSKEELLALMRPLIPRIEQGDTPSRSEIIDLIQSLIPEDKDIPETTGIEIVGKINELPTTPENQIDAKHIKNLPRLDKNGKMIHGGGISKVVHDTTLTGDGTAANPLKAVATPINFADNEVPTGSGSSFTLANTPVLGSLHLYRGGAHQQPGMGNDYLISGDTITLNFALASGEVLLADYRY